MLLLQAGEASHAADDGRMSGNEKLQQLGYRIKQLEEQLATAQESVAGATSTSKQFQSIAESNEAAMAQLQVCTCSLHNCIAQAQALFQVFQGSSHVHQHTHCSEMSISLDLQDALGPAP